MSIIIKQTPVIQAAQPSVIVPGMTQTPVPLPVPAPIQVATPAPPTTNIQPFNLPGFETLNPFSNEAYTMLLYGKEFSGKTRFLSTLPLPLAIICNDPKSADSLRRSLFGADPACDPRFVFLRYFERMTTVTNTKWIINANDDTIMQDPNIQQQMRQYRAFVDSIKETAMTLARHPQIRSIAVDSATTLYNDMQYAHNGQSSNITQLRRQPATEEFLQFVRMLTTCTDGQGRPKHIVLTAMNSDEYSGNKATGNTRAGGCSKAGYVVKNLVELGIVSDMVTKAKLMASNPAHSSTPLGTYYLNLVRSLRNPHSAGHQGVALLTNQDITYKNLMMRIYSDVDPTEFS